MLQTLLFILLFFVGINLYFRYHRKGRLLSQIPGPTGFPFLGNAVELLTLSKSQLWTRISKYAAMYYPVCKLCAPNIAGIIISDPEDIEILLSSTKHIEKSFIYRYLKNWLLTGLLTSKGQKWVQRRKMLTPAFHFNVLQKFVDIMSEHGQKMVNDLKSNNGPATIDLTPFLTKYTLSVICETAMGTPLRDDDGGHSDRYRKAIYDIGEIVVHRFLNLWNPLVFQDFVFNNFTPTGWKHSRVLKTLHNFSTKIINERKEYHVQTDGQYLKDLTSESNRYILLDDEKSTSGIGKKKRMAMLDIMIMSQRKNEIDDIGIREEVDTFVFEGHDTTASALTFAIQLLAQHPDIQAIAREEVNSVWDLCDGKIGINDLSKMCYLERCIKESLRLFPSVVFVSRQLTSDLQLKKYLIPRGCTVVVLVYDLHRDPRYWPDALKFDPDRFLPERSLNRHPYAYIPFSAGPRNCIGQKYALMELKMMCAYILRNCYLEAVERYQDFDRSPDLILKPQVKIHVKFIPIES